MNIMFFLTPKNNVAWADETDTLRQALEKLEFHGYSAIPLLAQDGTYLGTITEGDILWELKRSKFPTIKDMEEIRITQVPRLRDNKAVTAQTDMEEVLDKVMNQNFVPVVDDKKVFIGIITRKDIIQYLLKKDA